MGLETEAEPLFGEVARDPPDLMVLMNVWVAVAFLRTLACEGLGAGVWPWVFGGIWVDDLWGSGLGCLFDCVACMKRIKLFWG